MTVLATGGQPCTTPGPPPVARPVTTHLNAPVRSIEMLELHGRAGVEEVYAGVVPDGPDGVSLDSLPLRRDGEPCHLPTFRALGRLMEVAREQGVKVHFTADSPCVPLRHATAWQSHVAAAVEAGVATVVVGTLETLRMATRLVEGTDVQVVAGSVMGVSTLTLARHVVGEGAARVALPHPLLLDEIGAIVSGTHAEVEVPVQTGAGLDCSRCRLADLPGIGLGCRAGWAGTTGEDGPHGPGMLDGAGDCGLCDVPQLVGMGVAALQLPGRESPNLRQNAKVTQMYRRALAGTARGVTMDQVVVEIDRVELSWQMGWLPRLCEQQRCRFRDTPRTRAYV